MNQDIPSAPSTTATKNTTKSFSGLLMSFSWLGRCRRLNHGLWRLARELAPAVLHNPITDVPDRPGIRSGSPTTSVARRPVPWRPIWKGHDQSTDWPDRSTGRKAEAAPRHTKSKVAATVSSVGRSCRHVNRWEPHNEIGIMHLAKHRQAKLDGPAASAPFVPVPLRRTPALHRWPCTARFFRRQAREVMRG
jgi:hypothetical protein